MKYLTVLVLLSSFAAHAQNFSPSAGGSSFTSPSAAAGAAAVNQMTPVPTPGTDPNAAPAIPSSTAPFTGVGSVASPAASAGAATINQMTPVPTPGTDPNAPTAIPSNNPIQAQEFNTAPTAIPTQPTDNTLMTTPSNNPVPSTTPFPSGTGTSSGSENSNLSSPITTP